MTNKKNMLLHKHKIFSIGFLGIFAISLLFNFVVFDFCSARELEITYPNIGVTPPTETSTMLPDYIQYIFKFSLMLAGIIAFGSLVYGGFRYMTSVGSPDAIGEAKKQIMASLVGLTILLCSWLILNTINPQLLKFDLKKISGAQVGVIIYKQGGCPGGGSPEGEPGIDYLRARHGMSDLGSMNNKVGSIYRIEWEGDAIPAKGGEGSCVTVANGKSIELQWLGTGVYLCKNADKHECLLFKESSPSLPDKYDDNIKYVYFKQPDDGPKYAAVLHSDTEYKGGCELIEKDGNIKSLTTRAAWGGNTDWVSSVTVFNLGGYEGDGVILYRNKDYNKDGCDDEWFKLGKCSSTPTAQTDEQAYACKCWSSSKGGIGGMGYKSVDLNKGPDTETEENYGNSIWIDGDYMAILFSQPEFGGDPITGTCQVFRGSGAKNAFLAKEPIAQCGPTQSAIGYLIDKIKKTPHYGCFKSVIVRPIAR
jgi:hypothetical protein